MKANKGRLTRFETLGGYWRGYCLAEAGQRARENTGRADTANHTPACFRLANDGRAALKTGLHAQRGECSPQIGDNVEQCANCSHSPCFGKQLYPPPPPNKKIIRRRCFHCQQKALLHSNGNMFGAKRLCWGCLDVCECRIRSNEACT